jgi:uncharacterized protein
MRLLRMSDRVVSFAGELAERHSLRAYDAVHLAVALSIPEPRVVMVTWDRDLSAASVANGIAVVPQAMAHH